MSTSTATITWTTNEPATSRAAYGQGESYASSTPVISFFAQSHEVNIKGLAPGTNYFYEVISQNASGKTVMKSGFEFNTLSQKKSVIKAPLISGVSMDAVGTSTARIVWQTNVPAGGELRYGTTTAYDITDGGHRTLLTDHVHTLSGLLSDTTYYLQIIVRDAFGNETVYQNESLRTSAQSSAGATPSPTSLEEESSDILEVSEPEQGVSVQKEVPIIVSDDDESEVASSSGGGGGRLFIHKYQLPKPILTKVEGLNKQVVFLWPKKPPVNKEKIVIVRHSTSYIAQPDTKWVIHQGNSGTFADTGLKNGRTYYYSVFMINQYHAYSEPVYFSVIPKKQVTQAVLRAVPPVVQVYPIYTFPKDMRRGDENRHVEHLQVLLASERAVYAKGLITGYFGPLTEAALKLFQERHGLHATGIADALTRKKLEAVSHIEKVEDKASIFDAALSRGLARGASGGDVAILQQFLISAGVYPERLITGYFGPFTQAALVRFQKEQNLDPPSGYFGPLTKKRILNLIRLRHISL